ncbi:MAG TPA: hypothetical protein VH417_09385 [Vicinamibacterales bacterium]|jgi:hypothetical protein
MGVEAIREPGRSTRAVYLVAFADWPTGFLLAFAAPDGAGVVALTGVFVTAAVVEAVRDGVDIELSPISASASAVARCASAIGSASPFSSRIAPPRLVAALPLG